VSIKAEFDGIGWMVVARDTDGNPTAFFNPTDFRTLAVQLGYSQERVDEILAPMVNAASQAQHGKEEK
jgi:hypothetical protein